MVYEIRLAGAQQDDGSIDLHRLALLAQTVTEIARGALNIRIGGISTDRSKKSDKLQQGLSIKLSNVKSGSTVLVLECEPFGNYLAGVQGNVFRPEVLSELPEQTPMGLVIETFREALNFKEEASYLDKALLKKLKSFEKIFTSADEKISFSNQGSIPEVSLLKADFQKIQFLEESIPNPHEVIINGVIDELKFSKSRVTIITQEGPVNAVLSEEVVPENIAKFWGKSLTIVGTAHYQPGGKISFLFIEKIFEPREADLYFSKRPAAEAIDQQIQRKFSQKGKNQLADVIGKWPDDEPFEDLLKMLD